jgi:hypothetical protein
MSPLLKVIGPGQTTFSTKLKAIRYAGEFRFNVSGPRLTRRSARLRAVPCSRDDDSLPATGSTCGMH